MLAYDETSPGLLNTFALLKAAEKCLFNSMQPGKNIQAIGQVNPDGGIKNKIRHRGVTIEVELIIYIIERYEHKFDGYV